jgi:hypothetical protein
MPMESSLPSRESLEARARRLLEAARAVSGASVEELVRALGELQPRGAETRRSWYDWQEKPETISLLTGLAAFSMLGPQATVELLFGDSTTDAAGHEEPGSGELPSQQGAIAELVVEMAELRARIDDFVVPELAKQGELISRMLTGDPAIVPTAPTREQSPGRERRVAGD